MKAGQKHHKCGYDGRILYTPSLKPLLPLYLKSFGLWGFHWEVARPCQNKCLLTCHGWALDLVEWGPQHSERAHNTVKGPSEIGVRMRPPHLLLLLLRWKKGHTQIHAHTTIVCIIVRALSHPVYGCHHINRLSIFVMVYWCWFVIINTHRT